MEGKKKKSQDERHNNEGSFLQGCNRGRGEGKKRIAEPLEKRRKIGYQEDEETNFGVGHQEDEETDFEANFHKHGRNEGKMKIAKPIEKRRIIGYQEDEETNFEASFRMSYGITTKNFCKWNGLMRHDYEKDDNGPNLEFQNGFKTKRFRDSHQHI